jgi:hypothetical protein
MAKSQTIVEELVAVCDIDGQGKKETRQDFLQRVVEETAQLEEADWDGLSKAAQEWYNAAVDANNGADDIPDPDEVKAKPAARRGATKKEEEEPEDAGEEIEFDDLEVGMKVTIATKKSEVTGMVTAVDGEEEVVTVTDEDDEESEIGAARIKTITCLERPKKKAAGKKAPAKKAEPEDDPEDEDEPAAKKPADKAAEKEKPPRAKNPGVSITSKIRDMVCEDDSLTQEEIGKALTKEGLNWNPSTLQLQYTEVQRTIKALRELGRIKK